MFHSVEKLSLTNGVEGSTREARGRQPEIDTQEYRSISVYNYCVDIIIIILLYFLVITY